VPVFAEGKERLHPDTALAHGFEIRLGRVVGANPIEIVLMEAASDGSPMLTVCAVLFEGTGIAGGSIGSILLGPLGVAVRFQAQEGSSGTGIGILLRIVRKFPLSIKGGPLLKVGQRNIGTNVLVFKRYDVVNGPIGGVPGRLTRPQLPAEARAEDADPRMGWFSMTSEGVTNTAVMMRALPPSTT